MLLIEMDKIKSEIHESRISLETKRKIFIAQTEKELDMLNKFEKWLKRIEMSMEEDDDWLNELEDQ